MYYVSIFINKNLSFCRTRTPVVIRCFPGLLPHRKVNALKCHSSIAQEDAENYIDDFFKKVPPAVRHDAMGWFNTRHTGSSVPTGFAAYWPIKQMSLAFAS